MKKNANHAVVTIFQRAAENKNSRVADFGNICLVNAAPAKCKIGEQKVESDMRTAIVPSSQLL